MAHPQHVMPADAPGRRDPSGRARTGDRALELGVVRLCEHDFLDERRHAVLLGVARERSRFDGPRLRNGECGSVDSDGRRDSSARRNLRCATST